MSDSVDFSTITMQPQENPCSSVIILSGFQSCSPPYVTLVLIICFLAGLRLTLDIDYDEYLGLFSHMVGTRITIHPHNVTAFPEDYGVSAAPGKETGIGIRLEKILREEWPHPSNCTWGEQTELDYDGVYTVLVRNTIQVNTKHLYNISFIPRR